MSRDERVSLITNKENLGWSAGNNVGIRTAQGQLTILLSNDTVVEDGWLEPIVRAMDSDDSIGVAQPMVLSIFDRRSIDSMGGFPDPLGFLYAYGPEGPIDEVFHTEGVVMCIKKSVFKDVGLLDEDFFMEWDDSDFCWRARLMNYKVVVVTDSVVYHVRGGVTGATLVTRRLSNIRRYAQNHLLSMIKNYEGTNIIKFVPIAALLETGKAVFFGIRGRWAMAEATLEGLVGLPFKFEQIWTKRIGVQSTRKVKDDLILKKMVRFYPSYLKLFYDYQTRGKRPFLPRRFLMRQRL
jgi:GT2 family glycosyltransferase